MISDYWISFIQMSKLGYKIISILSMRYYKIIKHTHMCTHIYTLVYKIFSWKSTKSTKTDNDILIWNSERRKYWNINDQPKTNTEVTNEGKSYHGGNLIFLTYGAKNQTIF